MELDSAKANFDDADAELKNAQDAYDDVKDLGDSDLTDAALADITTRQAEYDMAQTAYNAALSTYSERFDETNEWYEVCRHFQSDFKPWMESAGVTQNDFAEALEGAPKLSK